MPARSARQDRTALPVRRCYCSAVRDAKPRVLKDNASGDGERTSARLHRHRAGDRRRDRCRRPRGVCDRRLDSASRRSDHGASALPRLRNRSGRQYGAERRGCTRFRRSSRPAHRREETARPGKARTKASPRPPHGSRAATERLQPPPCTPLCRARACQRTRRATAPSQPGAARKTAAAPLPDDIAPGSAQSPSSRPARGRAERGGGGPAQGWAAVQECVVSQAVQEVPGRAASPARQPPEHGPVPPRLSPLEAKKKRPRLRGRLS